MSEYVFRYANGYGCDMSALMDGGRETVGDYFASDATDHYGTLHEEIVRCRDCKHYEDGMINGRRYSEPYCGAIGELSFGALFEVTKDDFCSWSERKSDAK